FGAAITVGGGHIWVGAPHAESGTVYKISGTNQTAILTGPGRLGSHISWTTDGLWVATPLSGDGLGGVVNSDGVFIAPGTGGTGISLTAGPPAAYGTEDGWTTTDGQTFELPNRPTALAARDGQIGAGMAHGSVALQTQTNAWQRPQLDDEAGFSLATADINADGHTDWLVGAPGSNTVHGLNGTSLETLRTWTGRGRFGGAITACDLNGNGTLDLIIGAPQANGRGAVHLYIDLADEPTHTWTGHTDGSGFGFALHCDDGVLAVGAPGRADTRGRAIIIQANSQ
ncbi:MAG: FG-GAP repeat domain-containing protein, partial [Myxococcota bacterium]